MGKTFVIIHTMEYYSAIKRNELLIFATTWISLKSIYSEQKTDKKLHIVYDFIYVKF